MTLSRRNLLLAAPLGVAPILAAGLVSPASAQAQKASKKIDLKERLGLYGPGDDPAFKGISPNAVGSEAARNAEVSRAFRLIWDGPRSSDHMAIARYFQNITTKNADGELYNQEWAKRANPLITSLFGMTSTEPADGDQTSWCAAFVSFVLYAAGKPTKLCGQSGGYRSYAAETAMPKVGDIVVFQATDDTGAQGFGHVGFFLNETEEKVEVLGGNQGKSGKGAVNATTFSKTGKNLQLHSYRTVE